jgi:hypothetical protein
MNIYYPQVERRSQLSSYLLAVCGVCTVLMLALSLSRDAGLHWAVPSVSVQAVEIEDSGLPVAIPAPLPPAGQAQAVTTPEPAGTAPSILIPQAIPAPLASVP